MRRTTILGLARKLSGIAVAAFAIHCSLIAKSDLKAGIGLPCGGDEDCQASICSEKVCTVKCGVDADCAAPLLCFPVNGQSLCKGGCKTDAQCTDNKSCVSNACQATTRMAAILPGQPNGQDGWSTSHKVGLDSATKKYSSTIRFGQDPYAIKESVRTATDFDKAFDTLSTQGTSIFFTASDIGNTEAQKAAAKYPAAKFITVGARSNKGLANLGAYTTQSEPGWYVAGRLAAQLADNPPVPTGKRCIGLILPTPTHQIIREANAFVRGAVFQTGGPNPNPQGTPPVLNARQMKVVIRWLGATKDFNPTPRYPFTAQHSGLGGTLYREELLAAQLADLGCSVIAHRTETQRVVSFIEKNKGIVHSGTPPFNIFSMGTDIQYACYDNLAADGVAFPSCLGSTYWNWGSLYANVLDQITRGVWKGIAFNSPFQSDADGNLKIELSKFTPITGIDADQAQNYLDAAANNLGTAPNPVSAVFAGPYTFNNQRDLDKDGVADAKQKLLDGEYLSGEELDRMCWFTEGAWELPTPSTNDITAIIPALVPYGPPVTLPANSVTTLGNSAAEKAKYGDVIDYLSTVGQDPSIAMSCALSQ